LPSALKPVRRNPPAFLLLRPHPLRSPPFPSTTLFRSRHPPGGQHETRCPPLFFLHFHSRWTRYTETMRRSLLCVLCGCVGALSRSEEHTSELQSRRDLVCRLLLEKKNEIDTSTNEKTD